MRTVAGAGATSLGTRVSAGGAGAKGCAAGAAAAGAEPGAVSGASGLASRVERFGGRAIESFESLTDQNSVKFLSDFTRICKNPLEILKLNYYSSTEY